MKRKTVLSTLIIICSLMFGSLLVSAHPTEPAPPGERLEREGRQIVPGPDRHFTDERPVPVGLLQSAASSQPSAVALGEPGLSFRYVQTFGQTEVGYETDNYHLTKPSGLFIDSSDNLYVVEDAGYRLLRYNSSGTNTLSLGIASFCNESNNPTGFCTPRDIAVDGSGNIWLATGNRVVKYDSSGVYQTQLPAPDSSGRWSSGKDTTHFRVTFGVAYDKNNDRLFVSDRNNHRVQVYTIIGGDPVYSATIGVTDQPGGDNAHFRQPNRIAVDSLGRLYVVDYYNYRVQRCSLSGSWSCTTFGPTAGAFTGTGISVDTSNNVYIYDSDVGRVIKCSSGGACSDLVIEMSYSQDIAVDSSGNIYAGAYGHSEIRKYNSSGASLGNYLGTWHESYYPDGEYVFSPSGLAVAADGSLYVTESDGQRLLKINAAGERQWVIGDPGAWGEEDDQFSSPEGNPAISSSGNIYVPDGGNDRIQIFAPNGTKMATFGSSGSGKTQFHYPAGIAISPINGKIYVADRDNQRVQVYDSSHNHLATIGKTGVPGDDNSHFSSPYDVAVDPTGKVFVADYDNYRVQKCTPTGGSYSCATFVGITGYMDDSGDFNLVQPQSVELDAANRLYVVDQYNNRVQVYDPSGAYLTTIGGNWWNSTGSYRIPTGLAIDPAGNVYVGDFRNNRVLKHSPSYPGWGQVNINGFGGVNNSNIHSLAAFGTTLFAGTWNRSGEGGQIWKMYPDLHWSLAVTPGFGNGQNNGINHLLPFHGKLYAGVRNDYSGASIYRTQDGDNWSAVMTGGFPSALNAGVYRFEIFNDQIYAGTAVWDYDHGAEIWRSPSGDNGTWELVVDNGFDSKDNYIFRSSAVYNGTLYFTALNIDKDTWADTNGGIIIRSSTGAKDSWTKVALNGFGDKNNYVISGLVSFNGYLYASTTSFYWEGIQVWRCQSCDNQASWEKVVDNGFGNVDNYGISNLIVYNDNLYLAIGNDMSGMEVWSSRTGNSGDWAQLASGGFGNSNNASPYYNNLCVFKDALYIGMENGINGAGIWKKLTSLFVPVIRR